MTVLTNFTLCFLLKELKGSTNVSHFSAEPGLVFIANLLRPYRRPLQSAPSWADATEKLILSSIGGLLKKIGRQGSCCQASIFRHIIHYCRNFFSSILSELFDSFGELLNFNLRKIQGVRIFNISSSPLISASLKSTFWKIIIWPFANFLLLEDGLKFGLSWEHFLQSALSTWFGFHRNWPSAFSLFAVITDPIET